MEKVVKLRNPWGNTEWKGDWGDNSTKWTPELMKKCLFNKKDEGIFHMSFDDYKKTFFDT